MGLSQGGRLASSSLLLGLVPSSQGWLQSPPLKPDGQTQEKLEEGEVEGGAREWVSEGLVLSLLAHRVLLICTQ